MEQILVLLVILSHIVEIHRKVSCSLIKLFMDDTGCMVIYVHTVVACMQDHT